MKKNILIVDDNIENLNLLIKILEQEDYKIRPTKNCKLAIQSIEKEAPDLILMDVMLPDMNGYEACRIIKENEKYKNIPIIFISALNEVFDKIKAFLMGAVDYITKPFNTEEVKIRIKTHLDIVDYQKALEEKNLLLENANKQLELFVSFVSHDLRAPLRHVSGFTQFLKDEINNNLNDKSKKYLKNILESTKLMENLIENLLDRKSVV
jgi:two-component system, sensor histidine kinase and response regulator